MFGILSRLFGSNDDESTGLDALETVLTKQEATLDLRAEYQEPQFSGKSDDTAVFPYVTFDGDDLYAVNTKEFPIPDGGLEAADSDLVQFLADANGIDAEDVTFDDLANIQGMTANADISDDGEIVAETPSINSEVEVEF